MWTKLRYVPTYLSLLPVFTSKFVDIADDISTGQITGNILQLGIYRKL